MCEKSDLIKAVDIFAEHMKNRLLQKHRQGFKGWRTIRVEDKVYLKMRDMPPEYSKKDLTDIANYIMMIFNQRHGLYPTDSSL